MASITGYQEKAIKLIQKSPKKFVEYAKDFEHHRECVQFIVSQSKDYPMGEPYNVLYALIEADKTGRCLVDFCKQLQTLEGKGVVRHMDMDIKGVLGSTVQAYSQQKAGPLKDDLGDLIVRMCEAGYDFNYQPSMFSIENEWRPPAFKYLRNHFEPHVIEGLLKEANKMDDDTKLVCLYECLAGSATENLSSSVNREGIQKLIKGLPDLNTPILCENSDAALNGDMVYPDPHPLVMAIKDRRDDIKAILLDAGAKIDPDLSFYGNQPYLDVHVLKEIEKLSPGVSKNLADKSMQEYIYDNTCIMFAHAGVDMKPWKDKIESYGLSGVIAVMRAQDAKEEAQKIVSEIKALKP